MNTARTRSSRRVMAAMVSYRCYKCRKQTGVTQMDAKWLPDFVCGTIFTRPDKRSQEVVTQMDAHFFPFLERPTYLKKARSGGNFEEKGKLCGTCVTSSSHKAWEAA